MRGRKRLSEQVKDQRMITRLEKRIAELKNKVYNVVEEKVIE